jgi:hypothetical protein
MLKMGFSEQASVFFLFAAIFVAMLTIEILIKKCWLQMHIELEKNKYLSAALCALFSSLAFPGPFMLFGLFISMASTAIFYKSRCLSLSLVFHTFTTAAFFYQQIF